MSMEKLLIKKIWTDGFNAALSRIVWDYDIDLTELTKEVSERVTNFYLES